MRDEAGQKILGTFADREVVFEEDGQEVFWTTFSELGYSLDEASLKTELVNLQAQREAERRVFSVEEDFKLPYQVVKKPGAGESGSGFREFRRQRKNSVLRRLCAV